MLTAAIIILFLALLALCYGLYLLTKPLEEEYKPKNKKRKKVNKIAAAMYSADCNSVAQSFIKIIKNHESRNTNNN